MIKIWLQGKQEDPFGYHQILKRNRRVMHAHKKSDEWSVGEEQPTQVFITSNRQVEVGGEKAIEYGLDFNGRVVNALV